MAKGRIEQDIVLKVTGAKDVKDAAKLIDDLDGKTAEVDIRVDSETAETDVKSLTRLLHGLSDEDRTIVLKAQADQAEREIKKLTAQLGRAKDVETIQVKVDLLGNARERLDDLDRELHELDRQRTTVRVDADTRGATAGLARVQSQMSTAMAGIGSALKANIATAAATAGAAIAAFAVKAVGDFQDVALGAGQLRDSLGVTAEEASRLQEVAGDIGIGVDTLAGAMGKMNRAAALTPAAFDSINAAIARNRDGTINVTQTFLNAVDALNGIPDAADRAAAAQKIFGKGWMEISELIAEGADGVSEALASVESGKIMTDEDIARGREFRDMLDELKGVAEGASIAIGEDLVDSLQDVKTIVDQLKGPIEDFLGPLRTIEEEVPGGKGLRDWATGIIVPFSRIPVALDLAADAIDHFKDDAIDPLAPGFKDAGDAANNFEGRMQGAADATDVTADAVDGLIPSLDKMLDRLPEIADAAEEAAAAAEKHAIAVADAQVSVNDMASSFSGMARRSDALSSIFDLGNAPLDALDRVTDVHAGIEDLATFITEEGVPDIFDPDDVEAQPFLAKIAGLRGPIQTEITNAFAAGGPDAAKEVADQWVQNVYDQLGGAISKEDITTLLGLSDLEATIAVALEKESLDRTIQTLEVLTGLAGKTPYTASIELALLSGDITPEAAQILINDALGDEGVKIPGALETPATDEALAKAREFADANAVAWPSYIRPISQDDMKQVLADAQRYVDGKPVNVGFRLVGREVMADGGTPSMPYPGGIAGEKGPEILNRRYLTAGPTWVPPGTHVTSRRQTARIIRHGGLRGFKRYDRGGVVPAVPSVTNVNVKVNLPAGANGADAVRYFKSWARRNGSLV